MLRTFGHRRKRKKRKCGRGKDKIKNFPFLTHEDWGGYFLSFSSSSSFPSNNNDGQGEMKFWRIKCLIIGISQLDCSEPVKRKETDIQKNQCSAIGQEIKKRILQCNKMLIEVVYSHVAKMFPEMMLMPKKREGWLVWFGVVWCGLGGGGGQKVRKMLSLH